MDKKKTLRVALAVLAVVFAVSARGQQKAAAEAGPSYQEDAPSNRRRPGVDADVSFYITHWRSSPPREGHGGLIERDILTPGDPFHPREKGAVLRFLTAYRRAELPPHAGTRSFADAREQVFLFVLGGQGRIEADGRTVDLDALTMTWSVEGPVPQAATGKHFEKDLAGQAAGEVRKPGPLVRVPDAPTKVGIDPRR